MYKIKLTAKAKRELKDISKRSKESIGMIFEDFKEDPFLGKPLTRELTGKNSYQVGVYRIIYKIIKHDKIIQIITAGHRSTIYN